MEDPTAWRSCNESVTMPAIVKTRKKTGKKRGPSECDDLVRRNFTTTAPNDPWLVDITEHRTREGKLYLCAIEDVCSRRIFVCTFSELIKVRLAVDALYNMVARIGNATGRVADSDRGSQF